MAFLSIRTEVRVGSTLAGGEEGEDRVERATGGEVGEFF